MTRLLLCPASAVTSGSALQTRRLLTAPMTDPSYFAYLAVVHQFAKDSNLVQYDWTQTSQQGQSDVINAATIWFRNDAAAGLRGLTDQLRRGIIPDTATSVRGLAKRVVRGLEEAREENIDDWARRLAEDVADADD